MFSPVEDEARVELIFAALPRRKVAEGLCLLLYCRFFDVL